MSEVRWIIVGLWIAGAINFATMLTTIEQLKCSPSSRIATTVLSASWPIAAGPFVFFWITEANGTPSKCEARP